MTSSDKKSTSVRISRRTFTAGAAAGAASLVLPWRGAFAQGAKFKIGMILPTSGYQAQIGQDHERGVQLAEKVLPEMGYKNFEVLHGDTETKVEVARNVAEKLINEGCNVLVGAFDSGQTTAAVQVAEQKGIPFIVHTAANPAITESGYKWVVRNFPTVPMILNDAFINQKALFEYTKTTPQSVVILHTNDTYGTAVGNATPKLAKANGVNYKILDSIAYDPAAKDLSVEVAKAKASGADAVIGVSRLNDAILITREMIKQRWSPMGIMSIGPGWNDTPYLETLGKMSDDVMNFIPWYDPTKPLSKRLIAAMAKMFPHRQLHINHVLAFEGIYIAVDAYKRAGTTDPAALMKALRETHITNNSTISPAIAFDEKGQNTKIRDAGVQNRAERLRVVVPRSAAEVEPNWPMRPWNKRT